jgi:outer membrane biosynthesis protein TonB
VLVLSCSEAPAAGEPSARAVETTSSAKAAPSVTATDAASAAPSTNPTSALPAGSCEVGLEGGVAGGQLGNVGEVVREMKPAFDACYRQGLAKDPALRGAVTLVLKVGPKGDVTGVAGGASGPLTPITDCVKEVAGKARFSAPDNGVGATIVLPLTCSPK